MESVSSGSSPLTRGTQSNTLLINWTTGSSPLTRGTRPGGPHQAPEVPVHPRLRGELHSFETIIGARSGSSPLTRGTPVIGKKTQWPQRFIPAYAGNSKISRKKSRIASVHPRLRGELSSNCSSKSPNSGSSPLTRGTQLPYLPLRLLLRFIPAYAGNSLNDVMY